MGGCRPDCLSKVLPRDGSSGVTIWVRDLGDDSRNVSKYLGRTCGLPGAGDGEEGATDRGQFLVGGGGGKHDSGVRDKNYQKLH